jgi:hypothetical protein
VGCVAQGDILRADRLTANWLNILLIHGRGVELVSRLNKAHPRRTSGAGGGGLAFYNTAPCPAVGCRNAYFLVETV